jgi:hypothetical protein
MSIICNKYHKYTLLKTGSLPVLTFSHALFVNNCIATKVLIVGPEVLTAVAMKVAIFWDITPFSPYVNGRFGVTYLPSSSESKISKARKKTCNTHDHRCENLKVKVFLESHFICNLYQYSQQIVQKLML